MIVLISNCVPAAGSNELLQLVFEVFQNTRAGQWLLLMFKNHQFWAIKDNFPALFTCGLFRHRQEAALNLNLSFRLLLVVHSPVHHSPVREQESELQGHDSCSLKGLAPKCAMLWSADGLGPGWNRILSVRKTIWQFYQYLLEFIPFLDSKNNQKKE